MYIRTTSRLHIDDVRKLQGYLRHEPAKVSLSCILRELTLHRMMTQLEGLMDRQLGPIKRARSSELTLLPVGSP